MCASAIQYGIQSIQSTFSNIEDDWQSPAGSRFAEATLTFNLVTDNLMLVLEKAIIRMNTSYQNYLSTETANTNNLQ